MSTTRSSNKTSITVFGILLIVLMYLMPMGIVGGV
jgi:hypothetical protein